jgi:hypothetical protein
MTLHISLYMPQRVSLLAKQQIPICHTASDLTQTLFQHRLPLQRRNVCVYRYNTCSVIKENRGFGGTSRRHFVWLAPPHCLLPASCWFWLLYGSALKIEACVPVRRGLAFIGAHGTTGQTTEFFIIPAVGRQIQRSRIISVKLQTD